MSKLWSKIALLAGAGIVFGVAKARKTLGQYEQLDVKPGNFRITNISGIPLLEENARIRFLIDVKIYNPFDFALKLEVLSVVPMISASQAVGSFYPNNQTFVIEPKKWGTIKDLDLELPASLQAVQDLDPNAIKLQIKIKVNGVPVSFSKRIQV